MRTWALFITMQTKSECTYCFDVYCKSIGREYKYPECSDMETLLLSYKTNHTIICKCTYLDVIIEHIIRLLACCSKDESRMDTLVPSKSSESEDLEGTEETDVECSEIYDESKHKIVRGKSNIGKWVKLNPEYSWNSIRSDLPECIGRIKKYQSSNVVLVEWANGKVSNQYIDTLNYNQLVFASPTEIKKKRAKKTGITYPCLKFNGKCKLVSGLKHDGILSIDCYLEDRMKVDTSKHRNSKWESPCRSLYYINRYSQVEVLPVTREEVRRGFTDECNDRLWGQAYEWARQQKESVVYK